MVLPDPRILGCSTSRYGQPAEAETVFREDLRRNKRNGRSLFGLMKSLQAQGKTIEAEWVQQEYKAAWKGEPLRMKTFDVFRFAAISPLSAVWPEQSRNTTQHQWSEGTGQPSHQRKIALE